MSQQLITTLATISLALIMSVLVWIAAIDEVDPIINQLYSESIPLTIVNPGDDVVIANKEALTNRVQVRLIGPNSAWQNLTPNKFSASVNLLPYSAGLHNVPIEVDVSDSALQILEFFPAQLQIQLEPLLVRKFPLSIRIIGEPPKGFAYQLPAEPITITVKGLSRQVLEVERVESSVVINGSREPVERSIQSLAKNRFGETVSDVIVEPEQVTVQIGVEQRFGYSNVSVKARVVGEPASGYFINSITTTPDEIVLRGLENAPSSLETDIIDISGATEDVSKRLPITLPPGFSIEVGEDEDPEQARTVQVDIEVAAFTGGLSVSRPVSVEGVQPDLNWQVEPESVEVFLSGPWPLLQGLEDNDVTVIVDLFDFSEGVYRLEPTIIRAQQLEVGSIIPDIIEVTLTPTDQISSTDQISANQTPIESSQTESITSSLITTQTDTISGTALFTDTIQSLE